MNLNLALALERVGGDEELLKEIAGLFLEDYPSLITKIEQAIATNDAHNLERAVHAHFLANAAQRIPAWRTHPARRYVNDRRGLEDQSTGGHWLHGGPVVSLR